MNDLNVFADALSWAFSFISEHWALFLFPFVLSMSFNMFKTICGISGRSRRSTSVPSAPAPVPSAPAPVRCEGCSDCPFFADSGKRDESCPLHGTASCAVGLYVSGGKIL